MEEREPAAAERNPYRSLFLTIHRAASATSHVGLFARTDVAMYGSLSEKSIRVMRACGVGQSGTYSNHTLRGGNVPMKRT